MVDPFYVATYIRCFKKLTFAPRRRRGFRPSHSRCRAKHTMPCHALEAWVPPGVLWA